MLLTEELKKELLYEAQILYRAAGYMPFHEVVSIIRPIKGRTLIRCDMPDIQPLIPETPIDKDVGAIDDDLINARSDSIYRDIESARILRGGLIQQDLH